MNKKSSSYVYSTLPGTVRRSGLFQKLEDEEQVKLMEKLIDIMEEDDDEQNVWHNWEQE